MTYELLIEKTENGFRTIIFDIYEDMKCVVDIIDNPMPWMFAEGKCGFSTREGLIEGIALNNVHLNVDFGRVEKLGTKMKKICQTL